MSGALIHHKTVVTGYTPLGVHFDGTNDYIAVPDASAYNNLTSFTASCWIKIGSLADSGGNEHVFGRWTRDYGYPFDSNERGWYIKRDYPNNNKPSFIVMYGTSSVYVPSSATLSVGIWNHIAAVRNTGTGNIHIYVNGVKNSVSTSLNSALNGSAGIRIGGSNQGAGSFYFGSGCVKDCRLWNTALSDSDIASLYAGGDVTSNLVAWWPMHEGSGTTAADVIGGNNGTLTNGPTWSGC